MPSTTRADELMSSPVHKDDDEIAEMHRLMKTGELPPDAIERQRAAEAANVFGHDAKRDKNGKYIEQGQGAKGHETANHNAALLKAEREGFEPAGSWKRAVEELYRRDPARAKAINLPLPPMGVTA